MVSSEVAESQVFREVLEKTPLSTVMTTAVTCVRPNLGVDQLAEVLLSERISGVPVVDEGGRPIGIVSKTDLVRERYEDGVLLAELCGVQATVADLMTQCAMGLEATSSLGSAVSMMAKEGLHRLPIVDEEGRVVGLLSLMDVVRWLAREAAPRA